MHLNWLMIGDQSHFIHPSLKLLTAIMMDFDSTLKTKMNGEGMKLMACFNTMLTDSLLLNPSRLAITTWINSSPWCCYKPTCISLRGTKWQNIDRLSAQGDSEGWVTWLWHVTLVYNRAKGRTDQRYIIYQLSTIHLPGYLPTGIRKGIKGCSIMYLDQFFTIIFVNKALVTF